ncbi:hypothetical protein LOD99_4574 [Oopsacas minuta]|uniref:Uncharacterized protein n=1 Tax=Oopsacas minuta TaxID=111878 RepID=A0AAV7JU69_9METZ|nr:hypothetical protein LOD99_4574 [Oopsacas minuta]
MSIQGNTSNNTTYTHDMKSIGAQSIPNIPALPMIVVMFHMFFFILSLIPNGYPWTSAVIFINVFFFVLGLWATHDQNSAQAVFWMFCIHVSGILIDIIVLGLYFGELQAAYGNGATQAARLFQFSAAMMILNLLFKPLTVFVLVFLFWFRNGFGKVLAILKMNPEGENPYSNLDDGERS